MSELFDAPAPLTGNLAKVHCLLAIEQRLRAGDKMNILDVGSVQGNTASGAVINLAVEADTFDSVVGDVQGNNTSGAQGTFGLGSCTIAANYSVYVPHAGLITLQSDWYDLKFDNNVCTPQ